MQRIHIVSLLTLILFSLSFAGNITRTYHFDTPSIEIKDGAAQLRLEGCWNTGIEGEPELPVFSGRLLLPPGSEAARIEIETGSAVSLGTGFYVSPVQEQHPLSQPGPFSPTPENPAVYGADAQYPAELAGNLSTGFFRGYSIGYFTLRPLTYNPVTGEIKYYSRITVNVITEQTSKSLEARNNLYRGLRGDLKELEARVDNPARARDYGRALDSTDDGEVELLVITTPELDSSFQVFAGFKNAQGIPTEILHVDWIASNYTGIDTPDKIRNCIRDYYQNFELEYVLLAGDNEYVPKRSFSARVGSTIDHDIAADLYYGCLDGTWDANGNGLYGEAGEEDFNGEVYPGRAAVDSRREADNFVHKQIAYQKSPVAAELTNAIMVGEDLEWLAWGADYKEEIRLGSSAHGHTTAGFPVQFSVDTLYDRPGYYWSAMYDLLPRLNQGPQLVNHLGHANNTYTLKFGGANITDTNCSNDGVNHNYYIIYSQGCYCNSWDNRLPDGGNTPSDAIAEAWTTIRNGAVCFIGNTRYGWGSYSNTNGASQYFDREFFDAIFDQNIYQIGKAHQVSKEAANGIIGSGAIRYCYYECSLLGDPSLEIWTNIPQPVTVNCDTFINLGDSSFTLDITNVTDALCAVSQNGRLLGRVTSGTLGTVTVQLDEPVSSTDPVRLMVRKHDFLPFDVMLDVYVPNAPNVMFNGCAVNDITGDNDGVLDLGEESYLDITVTNFGGVNANSVTATLETEDLYVSILDGSENLGTIPHDATQTYSQAFQVFGAQDVPDGHRADFQLTMTDGSGRSWGGEFSLDMSAPIVRITDVRIEDGNNNRLSPGETVNVFVTVTNSGSGEARSLSGDIFSDNPYFIIDSGTGGAHLLESGQTAELSPAFTVSAASNCPPSANIPVYLSFNDQPGYNNSQLFEIIVGGIIETFENGSNWLHEVVTQGWNDQWTLSTHRNYTIGGATSWHCGPSDGSDYANHMDAGLITEEYDIQPGATLTFRHWMNAETAPATLGPVTYDGGIVEIKLDNGVFVQIFPVHTSTGNPGYNYWIRDYPDMGPFRFQTPVYSGEIIWEEAVFDLHPFNGRRTQFRFRFGSNSAGAREGWYIDDVELAYMAQISPPTNFAGEWADSVTLHLSWNSPATLSVGSFSKGGSGGRDSEGLLHYRVYRNDELLAEDVQGLSYDDDMRLLPSGTYSYQVSAVFTKGESALTTPLYFDYTSLSVEDGKFAEIPEDFFIDQNYPNPFNPRTSIRFGLPQPSNVKLTVYDILGRQVAKLVEGRLAAGIHTAVWEAGGIPSGIYFYRIEAGEFRQMGKMLLIK